MILRASLPLGLAAAIAFGTVEASSPQTPPSSQPSQTSPSGQEKPRDDPKAPPKRRRVVSDLSGFELLDAAKLQKKPMVAGAGRSLTDLKPPNPLAPHLTRLYGSSPEFRWRAHVKGQRFSFVLSDAGLKEVHRAETVRDSYSWPVGAVQLGDGRTYYWTVQNVPASGAPPPTRHGVQVVSPQERVEIEQALRLAAAAAGYEGGLARAQVFTDQRLWYDAIGAYTELIAQAPDRAEAYERRGMIYAQIPVTQSLAKADFARADELTGKQ